MLQKKTIVICMKKAGKFLKELICSRKKTFSFLRCILFILLILVSHMLFLALPKGSGLRGAFSFLRGVGMLLCLTELLRQIRWRQVSEKIVRFLKIAGGFLLDVITEGVMWLSGLLSSAKGRFQGTQQIGKYSDETIKVTGTRKSRKKTRRWKNFGRMDGNEKIRFFFWRKRITWEKQGMPVKESSTPAELLIQSRSYEDKKREKTEKLISEYQKVRYQEAYRVGEETVDYLKEG